MGLKPKRFELVFVSGRSDSRELVRAALAELQGCEVFGPTGTYNVRATLEVSSESGVGERDVRGAVSDVLRRRTSFVSLVRVEEVPCPPAG